MVPVPEEGLRDGGEYERDGEESGDVEDKDDGGEFLC